MGRREAVVKYMKKRQKQGDIGSTLNNIGPSSVPFSLLKCLGPVRDDICEKALQLTDDGRCEGGGGGELSSFRLSTAFTLMVV
jgi:hypothetical protein